MLTEDMGGAGFGFVEREAGFDTGTLVADVAGPGWGEDILACGVVVEEVFREGWHGFSAERLIDDAGE